MLVSIVIWYFYGKDKVIEIEKNLYPDKRLNFLDVVRLYKERVTKEDVIYNILYLCSKGYIKIEESKDDIKLVRVKKYSGHSYNESLLMDALFLKEYSGSLSGVIDKGRKKDYYDSVSVKDVRIRRTIDLILSNENMDSKRYEFFERGTDNKKKIILGFSIISMLLIIINPFLYYNSILYVVLGMVISFILFYIIYLAVIKIDFEKSRKYLSSIIIGLVFLVLVFSFIVGIRNMYEVSIFVGIICIVVMNVLCKYMPRRTIYGTKLYCKLEGFKQVIENSSSKELKDIMAINDNYYYDILAYTYIFDNRNKVVDKFKIVENKCEWFDSYEEFKIGKFNKLCDVLIDILRENN